MTEIIKEEIRNTKHMFWTLAVSIAVFLIMYLFFLSHTIYTAVLRQQTEKSIASLENNAGSLESQYVSLKNAITSDMATSKGFIAITSTKYVPRQGTLSTTLSLNTSR